MVKLMIDITGLNTQDVLEHENFEMTWDWFNTLLSVEYGEEAIRNWAYSQGLCDYPPESYNYDQMEGIPSVSSLVDALIYESQAEARRAQEEEDMKVRMMIRTHIQPFQG